jgi:hypothetical protein
MESVKKCSALSLSLSLSVEKSAFQKHRVFDVLWD